MKKYLFILMMSLFTMISYAQTESSHLSFKGVPIDGNLNEFVQKMKQKGFMYMGTEDEMAMLRGDFAGYKGCLVGVYTLKQRDLVSNITVMFPERETWLALSNNYFSLKKMLTEKYGSPTEVTEEFQGYSEPRDDYYRFHEVKMDRCRYISSFETSKGTIRLAIGHSGYSSCYVTLAYIDKINNDSIRADAMDDL